MKTFKPHWTKVLSIFLFILLFGAYTHIFAVFSPGQTLNPNCSPGVSGCIVESIPSQTGNGGKYLTTDGTNMSWNSTPAGVTASSSDVFTNKNLTSLTNTFPTFNQNTTGSAGSVTNATLTTALTVNTGTVTLIGNVANTSALTLGAGASSVSGSNTGDNAANTTYASDYRAANFVAGTNYLAPNGSAAALTSFPTFNQNTTGTAAGLSVTLASISGGSGVNNAGNLIWGAGGTLGTNAYTSTAYIPYTGGTSNVDLGVHDLTVDTNSLFVNSTSHRVGLGTISPTYKLEISGSASTDGIRTTAGIDFNQVPNPASAPTMALITAAGNVNNGTHYYAVTYVTALGETSMNHNGTAITTDGTHGQVTVTIPVSPDTRVTARKIYRTKAGGNWWDGYYLATVSDNSTTSYVDNIADASITVYAGEDRANTTNNQLTVNGTKSMLLDLNATWVGYNAGSSVTSAGYSTLVGSKAGQYLTSGNLATFVGSLAGRYTTTGSSNTFIGEESGYRNTTGYDNSYTGYASGLNNVTGNGNTAIGAQALSGTSTQSAGGSTAVGAYSLYRNYGNYNTALGNSAGVNNLTGTGNVFIGASSGYYETGSNKLFIDTYARASEADARTKALIYGIFDASVANQKLVVNGNLGIGAASPGYTLQAGNSGVTGIVARFENSTGTCDINPTTTALVCPSDINLKKNIITMDNEEFILQTVPDMIDKNVYTKIINLTPVHYNWKVENDSDTKHPGFIAQEVEQIFPDLVTTDPITGLKSIGYSNLTPYIVKAMQEMNLMIVDINNMEKDNSWRNAFVSWFSNSANGITNFFSKEIHTDKICVKRLDGTERCVTGEELDKALGSVEESIIPDINDPAEVVTSPIEETTEVPVQEDVSTSEVTVIQENINPVEPIPESSPTDSPTE